MRRVIVIGIGGTGTALLPFLCRYLNYQQGPEHYQLFFVDGDSVESKNLLRQDFEDEEARRRGNKAISKVNELAPKFFNLSIRPVPEYVTHRNIKGLVKNGDIVFLAVDRHPVRRLVSKHCEKLSDVILIASGNELTDGSVQIYIRKNGRNITNPLTTFHPEIENATESESPKDLSPDENCELLAEQPGTEQILPTNALAGALMLINFWKVEQGLWEKLGEETYFDILESSVVSVKRKVKEGGAKNGSKTSAKRKSGKQEKDRRRN